MKKTNPQKHNRYSVILVVALLLAMLSTTVVGCGKPSTIDDSAGTSEVVSETPSTSEVSESISEESSSEEVISEEIVPEVEITNFSTSDELRDYLKTLNKTTIVNFDFSEEEIIQAIIPNGASYIVERGTIRVISPQNILEVNTSVDYVESNKSVNDNEWVVRIQTTGTNIEVPLTIMYEDGTIEEYTVYITKEWE